MNKHAKQAITGMLNCFPQTNQDYQVLLLTLEKLLAGLSDEAVIRAAEKFAAGDVRDQSKTFAPSGPEFIAEVKFCQEIVDLKARLALPAPQPPPSNRPSRKNAGPVLSPFEIAKQQSLNENANRAILHENVCFDQWCKMSRRREIPVGAKWVARLGIVFGPEQIRQAAE
jgi:hypothetical protein